MTGMVREGRDWVNAFARSLIVLAVAQWAAAQVITTVAGTSFTFPASPLPALSAPLGRPAAMAVDSQGNVYVGDYYNNIVVQISPSGVLTVLAGNGIGGFSGDGGPAVNASVSFPNAVALDSAGNLYICDSANNRIRKVSNGTITTIAGSAVQGYSGDGGPATNAELYEPNAVAVDSAGNVYIADTYNYRIRKVSGGIITTIAGNGLGVSAGDGGPATSASFEFPSALAVDSAGNIYVVDGITGYGQIREISGGTINAIAQGAISASAVGVDASGNLYIAGQALVQKISGGVITTVAGNGNEGFSGDGGPPTDAELNETDGVAVDSKGNVYISDSGNERIRKVTGGIISTIAGNGAFRFSGNGGPATDATLNAPRAVAFDPSGNYYIADAENNQIREVSGGIITTLAGNLNPGFSGDGGPPADASLLVPSGVTVDSAGNVYIADSFNNRVREVSGGIIKTIAGNGNGGFAGDGGAPTAASLWIPWGLAVDSSGSLYIADYFNNRVRKVSGGFMTTVAGNGVAAYGGDGGPAINGSLQGPTGLAVDANGNLYIADSHNNRIREISGGVITTVAGNGEQGYSGDGGPATAASLWNPYGVALDASGNLYIADGPNSRIRKVSGGIITTVAGDGLQGFSGDGGPATAAELGVTVGVALDATGNIYIVDGNNRIREVLSGAASFQASPTALSFTSTPTGDAPAAQNIALSSTVGGLAFTTSTSSTWLSVQPASGSMPAALQVSVDPTGLAANTYQGTITITAASAVPPTRVVAVTFTVTGGTGGAAPAQLAVSPQSIPFSIAQGGAAQTAQFTIFNTGGGSAPYAATAVTSSGGNWLTIGGPVTGSVSAAAPVTLSAVVNPGPLAPGTYNGAITVTGAGTGQTLTIAVIFAVTTAPPKILLSQAGLTFTAVAEGGTVLPQTIGIQNAGAGTLDYSIQVTTQSGSSGWLAVSPASGSIASGAAEVADAGVSINAGDLPPPGTYYGQIMVSAEGASNSPQTVLVVLTVLPPGSDPGPDVRPTGLVFVGTAGGGSPGSQNVTVGNPSSSARSAYLNPTPTYLGSAPGSMGWLQYQPINFAVPPDAPQAVVVQPDFSNLAAGQYRAVITLAFDDGSTRNVSVLSVVTSSGAAPDARLRPLDTAGCTPSELLPQFTATGFSPNLSLGYPVYLAAIIVDDCGDPMTTGTVIVSFDNGDSPVSLVSQQNGSWTNSWQPGHTTGSVTLTLTATLENLSGAAMAFPGAVVQGSETPPMLTEAPLGAGTLAAGPFAPGDVMLLKGTGLADGQAISTSSPLESQLAGASVLIGQTPLQLLYADTDQVLGLVPANLAPNSSQEVIVSRDSAYGVEVPVIISATHPAILTVDGSGEGQGVIYASTGAATTIADAANPVSPGASIIIYCTGLGATAASGASANMPSVTIGGVGAQVSYSGAARPANYPPSGPPTLLGLVSAGLGGLYEIDATVPAGLPGGAAPVLVISAGQSSQSAVTIAIAGQGATAPSILPGGIVNAASYAAVNGAGSPVAPGSLIAIFTSTLATQPASFTTATLPTTLSGVGVTFNGVPAAVVQVVPSGPYPFVSAQVPFEVLTAGQTSATVPVVITVNEAPSAAAQAQIVASAPGIFTLNAEGTGQAVLVNLADDTIAAPTGSVAGAHPIPRGQTAFFYVTGLGAMTPSVADGSGVCPAASGFCNAAMPTVLVGGVAAQVVFAGQAPGFPGVEQINLTIPPTAPTGSGVSLIVISADGTVTSNTTTIAVQ